MKRITSLIAVLSAAAAILFAGGAPEDGSTQGSSSLFSEAKYVFFFIGDGMAQPQITAAESYLAQRDSDVIDIEQLNFTSFPAQGMNTTHALNQFITDSAAAGTALATGHKTNVGVISMDASNTVSYQSIAEMAHDAGMKVGIVSSVSLDHATPASFYAHQASRNDYYSIGLQMLESGFDYFGGGGVKLGKTPEGSPTVPEVLAGAGWNVIDNAGDLAALNSSDVPVYAATYGFAGDALSYALDGDTNGMSFADFVDAGIRVLDNPDGFFMMAEAGKIDWAGHANDAAANINDTLAMNEAIEYALDFYNEHPDETLIIVTGDHECGGLTIGFAGTKYATAIGDISQQNVSFEWFNANVMAPYKSRVNASQASLSDLEDDIAQYFGLTDWSDYERARLEESFAASMGSASSHMAEEEYLLYGGYEPLTVTITHLLNQRAGLAWSSYSHTAVPVPVFAIGVGQELFNGYYDNTDVAKKIMQAMGINTEVAVR